MKKQLSLVLSALMIFGITSCGGADTEVSDTNDKLSSDSQTSAETEADIYSVLTKRDFNEAKIRILGYAPSYNDVDSFVAEQTGDVIDDAIYQRNTYTEELLNVKLAYDLSSSYGDSRARFLNGVYAGDQECDIFIHKAGPFGSVITTGTLRPFDDVEWLNMDMPWYVQTANETARIGGKHYALFGDACKTNITMCWTTVFNKRLAEEWKIEDPYEIVTSGAWTMDKLISLTKDVWRDLNGNNERDDADLYGFYTDKWATIDAYMGAHRINVISKDKDDYFIIDFYSERLVESFEKIYDLYWNNPGTYVDTSEPYEYRLDFAEGRALFSPMIIDYMISNDLRSMKDDYGILPYPKLDEAQDEYGTYLLTRTGMMMLPMDISADKLEMVGYVIDALSAYSYKYLRPALYDQSLTTKGTRDERSIEMLELIMANRVYDFSGYTETGGKFPFSPSLTYRGLLGSKNANITSYYESNLSKAEAYIADLVNVIKENEKSK